MNPQAALQSINPQLVTDEKLVHAFAYRFLEFVEHYTDHEGTAPHRIKKAAAQTTPHDELQALIQLFATQSPHLWNDLVSWSMGVLRSRGELMEANWPNNESTTAEG